MSTRRVVLGTVVLLAIAIVLASPVVARAQGITRYANPTDPTCGGQAPCYTTIQAAVNAVLAADTIQLQAGTYHEQVSITGKNSASTSESDRIIIQADPAAPVGSVVLQGSVTQCTNGYGVKFQQSRYITLRGLTITGAGGQAISLMGGNNQNQAIHLERLRIYGNGSSSCDGGITIARGNPDTLLLNSLIYGNGRNGFSTIDADGGPHYLIGNTIHGNAWSGVFVTRSHVAWLVNNAITGNGTATGSTGGRFGVSRESSTSPDPVGIHLLNNLICANRLGEINGPALDGTDAGNLTPTGGEGPGVMASSTCAVSADVYTNVAGPDNLLNTADDDFTPVTASPLLDAGLDPRTLGLDPAFNPLLESDYLGPAARPRVGLPGGTARFDIGAREPSLADQIAPLVTFLTPAANAYVRGTITVQAQAQDSGSGVASFGLTLDTQAFSTTLAPALPPPASSVTATTSWNTATVADGAHNFVASAVDAAGNHASAPLVVLVDNTPPDTQIVTGPSGEILVGSATFTFSGSDNLTPVGSLVFSYQLDGGAWSAFAPDTTVTFPNLAETSHTFAVKARDLAGNEDPTPATRSFSVSFRPGNITVSPSSGPIGTYVTISGVNFEPGTTTVSFNGLAAVLRTITPTQITTTVPVGAATGPLTVTNSHGSTSTLFTVTLTGDFVLTAAPASPASVTVVAGDQGAASIGAAGSGSFTSLVSLSVSAGASGIATGFAPPLVAPGGSSFLTFAVASSVSPGTYSFTVTGQADVDGHAQTRSASVTLEVIAPTTPVVTGRVLTAEAVPKPIPGVQVTLASGFAPTDAAGNFVLQGSASQPLPPGPQRLRVDGTTASPPPAQYPLVEVQINVASSGPSRVPFILYLPALDTAHPITLPLGADDATTDEVQATTPLIPGLVVTIPKGTKITGPDGLPVRQLIITPVPVDRSPMPFPPGKAAPMLFAIHPGGSVPSQPLPISFPNVTSAEPGTKADLYFFDLSIGGWNTWGTGTVNADGTQVVSDPGFGLPRLAWHWTDIVRAALKRLWNSFFGGDPVDLATGIFAIEKTDVLVPGRTPIAVRRSYRSDDSRQGFFGIGWNVSTYDSRLTSASIGNTLTLTTPDQNTIQLRPTGSNQWASSDPILLGAVITRIVGPEFSFQIRYKDGSVHRYDRIVGFANTAGLSSITDRKGNTVTITRSSPAPGLFGLITQITGPDGRSLTLGYDTSGRIISATDPIGRIVQYSYDAQGHLASVVDPAGGRTDYTYDASHRIRTITDPRSITQITNEYDAQGRVIRQTQADGGVFTFAYNVLGPTITQTVVTDPRGNTTTHRFNDLGLPLSTTDALGQITVYEYTPDTNLLLSITDHIGRVTRFAYDTSGNVTTITDPAGTPRQFTYEPSFNRIATITTPLVPPTQFAYDDQGNVRTITDPRGKNTTLTYNASGQPLTASDPLGHVTSFTYDAFGNLASVADPLGNTTRFEYDAVSRLTRRTDPTGRSTTYEYDSMNRVKTITDAQGGSTRFTYDGNGNLLTVTDARSNPPATYGYDSMDRLATRTDSLGASESFVYDLAGNLIRRTDRKGQVSTFSYDALNRLTITSYADASGTTSKYDAANRLVRIDDSIGGTLTNTYDLLDRLLAQSTALGTISYAYDVLGRRTQLNVPGLPSTTYAYNANSRLTQILRGAQTTAFDYDDAGRRTLLTLPNGVSTQYNYDAASRLTSLAIQNAAGSLGDLAYQYDAGSNRVRVGGSLARTLLPTAVTTATYDAANRQTAFGASQMTYDANGNLTTIGGGLPVTSLTWDARDRLIGLEQAGTSASFAYAFGRRTAKTVSGATTQFLYDGLDIVQQLDSQRTTTYLRSLAIDETLGLSSPDGAFYLTADALGSTIAVRDETANAVTEYTYDSFGAATATNPGFSNQFQFTGRENDGTAGLYYYRARYYHPGFGRFISQDPTQPSSDINAYSYVENNPLTFVDALGLDRTQSVLPPAGDNRCDLLRAKIQSLTDELIRRADKIVTNPLNLPRYGPKMTVESHQKKFEQVQGGLQTRLKKYQDLGCGDPPPGALDWATQPTPQPAPPMPTADSQFRALTPEEQMAVSGAMATILLILAVALAL